MGTQEPAIVCILLLLLAVFGPSKFSSTGFDLGYFLGSTRCILEEVKSELLPEEVAEARRAIKDFKSEAVYGTEQDTECRKA